MDKTTSVLAALDAGKLPSTEQINGFIDWLADVGIARVEPTGSAADVNPELSRQGRVLANDLRGILDAYKSLGTHKNNDNILQQAIWHLSEGDLTTTGEAEQKKDQALEDLNTLRESLRTLISVSWSSFSSEGSALFQDFLSILRLSLADAAELLEEQAGYTKQSLRDIESEVQNGKRDALGRDKQRLEEEKDPKVAWQHGMDTVKDAGTSVIGGFQSTNETVKEKSERTENRLQDAWFKITDRAQRDPDYRNALDTFFGVIQKRLHQLIDAASDPNTTLSSFIADPTPEQHVPKALSLIRTLIERLCGTSLEPLIQKTRTCANSIVRDQELQAWFDDSIAETRKNLAQSGYARSQDSEQKRKELRTRWRLFMEKDDKWKAAVDDIKSELKQIHLGFQNDGDLNRLREAHEKFGGDVERGLVEATNQASEAAGKAQEEIKTGMQAAIEQATWFWQDLFKVYVPRFLNKMKDFPIPRTEFKDSEIELVLENLDISKFNILPSHVYIRNITDVDIQTSSSPSVPSKTSMGGLTHIKIEAAQLELKDVSFWYKDLTASAVTPDEYAGLMEVVLPPKGITIDLKVRLIPAHVTGKESRETKKRFHVVERAVVSISDDVTVNVRESNHTVLLTVFKPLVTARLKDALEKTLTQQLRALVDTADGLAFDVFKRRQVFEDTGLGTGTSLVAAMWSELGRLQRHSRESGFEVGWHATGTGLVVEQRMEVEGTGDEFGENKEVKRSVFAMGGEPQILAPEKRGPIGTGSEPLNKKAKRLAEESGLKDVIDDAAAAADDGEGMDVDVDVEAGVDGVERGVQEVADKTKGLVKEGQRQYQGFKKSVARKAEMEKRREGWESAAFDL